MVDVVETAFNIRIKNIFALESNIAKDCSYRIMGTASRSETIAIDLKQGFPLRFKGGFG
ncbi:hypothetical protein KDH_61300 [Dictyobacter sp. S3.2.2.5]|uniref:Uncharacterized protein n=1 Tax=Dictyobacter halimunensis TaxID=3026934 RepID=A0ABQ6G2H3_9CHLR|nr:hypothetical protein KDH_61300 [Dictyobacter sp. S3.2.2.5]